MAPPRARSRVISRLARGPGAWRVVCGCGLAALLGLSVVAGRAATAAAAAGTPAVTELDRYLDGLNSLRTDFTQTVTDAHGTQTGSGSGSLLLQRPGKFRWDYQPGAAGGADASASGADQGGQLLVADGRDLWFYDRELAQVTVKPIDAALSSTPIMLLSGSPARLRASFAISAAGSHDGLQWVDVKPRSDQADFTQAQLGFKGQRLVRMIFHNALGQTVRLDFSHSQRNVPISASAFEFKAPRGVDVIGKPQP